MEQDPTPPTQKWSLQTIGQHLASAMVGGALAFAGLGLTGQTQPTPLIIEPPLPTATAVPTATPSPIRVHINGAVQEAGVYTLPPNSILEDLVALAEGFEMDAYTNRVNLAQPLADGMQIYIPNEEEYEASQVAQAIPFVVEATKTTSTSSTSDTPANAETASGLININTASQSVLETLPGVGPSTAEKIIAYREEVGLFTTIQDIMSVSGIGTGKFANMESFITVE